MSLSGRNVALRKEVIVVKAKAGTSTDTASIFILKQEGEGFALKKVGNPWPWISSIPVGTKYLGDRVVMTSQGIKLYAGERLVIDTEHEETGLIILATKAA